MVSMVYPMKNSCQIWKVTLKLKKLVEGLFKLTLLLAAEILEGSM